MDKEAKRAQEERNRLMVEYSSDIITLLDSKGVILFLNPSIQRVLGYKPEELEGKVIFDFIHPDERIKVMDRFKNSVEHKVLDELIQFRFLTKDGSWRFLEAIGSTVLDENHGLIAVINSRDVTERVKMEQKLFSMSVDDPLTGLLNRRGFMILCSQQLKIAKRTKHGSCLLYVDLDQLKKINDDLGHAEGDRALVETANILKKSFRDPDIVARLGGDEFVVLAINANEIHAGSLIDRLKVNLTARNQNASRKYPLSLSAGVVYSDPRNHSSIEDLISRADMLMYEQKRLKQKTIIN